MNGKISAEQYQSMIREARKKFRITTNGIEYHVAKQVAVGLFPKSLKWSLVGDDKFDGIGCFFAPRRYQSRHDAEAAINFAVKEEVAGQIGFIPIEDFPEELHPDNCQQNHQDKPQDCVSDCAIHQPIQQPHFVYRVLIESDGVITYEIGERFNPRVSQTSWCDSRICEGFWGDEDMVRFAVKALNRQFDEDRKIDVIS